MEHTGSDCPQHARHTSPYSTPGVAEGVDEEDEEDGGGGGGSDTPLSASSCAVSRDTAAVSDGPGRPPEASLRPVGTTSGITC